MAFTNWLPPMPWLSRSKLYPGGAACIGGPMPWLSQQHNSMAFLGRFFGSCADNQLADLHGNMTEKSGDISPGSAPSAETSGPASTTLLCDQQVNESHIALMPDSVACVAGTHVDIFADGATKTPARKPHGTKTARASASIPGQFVS